MSGLSSERSSIWEMSKLEITDCTDWKDEVRRIAD